MKFKELVNEVKLNNSTVLKTYLVRKIIPFGYKDQGYYRGGVQLRFPTYFGSLADLKKFFKNFGVSVEKSDVSISGKYTTYILTATDVPGIPNDTTLYYVNSALLGNNLFKDKDLTPDRLGLSGKILSRRDILGRTSENLITQYPNTAQILIGILEDVSKSNNKKIKLSVENHFSDGDLRRISKNFGEIISAIWICNTEECNYVEFPKTSNSPLVDFYGVKGEEKTPYSVKSGSGSKVSLKGLLSVDAGTENQDVLDVIRIIDSNNMKDGIIELNRKFLTPGYNFLSSILGKDFTTKDISKYFENKSYEDVQEILITYLRILNYTPRNPQNAFNVDKLQSIIGPLGERVWRILNQKDNLITQLNNIARRLNVQQINTDISNEYVSISVAKFNESEFKFGWPGYISKNKIGFQKK